MQKMTPTEYGELVKKASPNSRSYRTIPMAFLVGGFICALGEGLRTLYLSWGLQEDVAGGLVSVTLIFLSVLCTGLNLYDNLAKYAGAGTLVPITGFANAVASPTLEFKQEGMVLGMGAKMFTIAGPVILYGVLASFIYGAILWVFRG